MSKRFDLTAASILQSRDGTVDKGGLITNGFAEKNRAGVWNWQRPALSSGMEAPITGNGLGFYVVGSNLWGLYHNGTGTATSESVSLSGRFNLTAVLIDGGVFGLNVIPNNNFGSINPTHYKGVTIYAMYSDIGTSTSQGLYLAVNGIVTQNFFTVVRIGSSTHTSAAATYESSPRSLWFWPGVTVISSAGLYPGSFAG